MSPRSILASVLFVASAAALFAQPQIQITSTSPLPGGYTGIPYNYTFTAVTLAGATVTWSGGTGLIANSLPTGLTLFPNGTLAGTTAQAGTFNFLVTATAGAFSTTQTFSLTILGPVVTINSPPILPNAFTGQLYSVNLLAASSPAGVTWLPVSLPDNLSLSSNGVVSGNPTSPGTFTFLITVEIAGTTITTNQLFTLNVYNGQASIATTSLPYAVSGMPYTATLSASPAGVTYVLSGQLPPGITFNPTTGVFGGASTFIGAYPIQVQANYPNYLSATRNLVVYVTTGGLGVAQPNLPPAVQGSAYTTTVSPTGGLAPYQWSFNTPNTDGLTISGTTGTITGTPTNAGNFVFPITLSDASGQSVIVNLSLFVANSLSVGTISLPIGDIGVAYFQSLIASGGTSPFTWNLVSGSGSLPPGLALASSGQIAGSPTSGGTFAFVVQVTDSGGRTATKALSISIAVGPVSITTTSLPNGQPSVAYSQQLAAQGGVAPYTWSLVSGSLPAGLALNPNGTISGTPIANLKSSTFTVQVADSSPGTPLTAQKAFTINIALTLTITTLSLPNGTKGVAYPQTQILASGGTAPYTWSISSGALPAGLQLNGSTGAITGTPTATGTTVFVVVVTDAAGQTTSQQLNITVNAPTVPLTITTGGSATATVGAAFSLALAATGGTAPYNWSAAGLPSGLQLSGSALTGTPTAAGTFNVALTVTDANQQTATGVLAITVSLPSIPTITLGTISGSPAAQAGLSLTLGSAFPVDIAGTLSVSFASTVGGNPTEVQFVSSGGGSSTASFIVKAGTTSAVFTNSPVLATGTVAGIITLTVTNLSAAGTSITPPSPQMVTIAPSAPVIQSVNFTNSGGGLTVTVIGYSTTREMVSGQFTFAPATGSSLSQSTITVQLTSAFAAWYASSASNQFGGQFMLTLPFSVSGTAADVVSVSVSLGNTKGTSASVSPH